MKLASQTSLLLALILCIDVQAAMLKCVNERGQVEYRNTSQDDPSCKQVSKAIVPSSFPKGRVYIGMSRSRVIDNLGQPKATAFRELPEGRVEAWIYEDGTQVGFKGDVLVWIEKAEHKDGKSK